MKHDHFSVNRIANFRCKSGQNQTIYWDGYAPGLGVRVTYWFARLGKPTFNTARNIGALAISVIIDFMLNPVAQKKKRGKGLTVAGVLDQTMGLRLSEITADVLIKWLKTESAKRPTATRRSFKMFRTFWIWCATRPEYSPVVDAKILERKDLRDEVPKSNAKLDDVLQRAHLKPWFTAVRGLSNPVVSAYLQTLLLTGSRREELAQLRWEDVDFKYDGMRLKDKVERTGRQIPLTPYVSTLLGALPRENEWVFSSVDSARGRLVEPRKAHNCALAISGLKHVSLHGLRRTFSSLAEWLEIPEGIKAQIMGHKPSATAEKHYNYRPLELLAIWHQKYEAWILREADVRFGKKKPQAKAPKTKAAVPLRLVSSR